MIAGVIASQSVGINLDIEYSSVFSLRKIVDSYNGNAVRVIRDSDNTEIDIGFNSSGDLDETALINFAGVSSCKVVTWYNQANTSNNATQSNNSVRPTIVDTGSIVKVNGKASIFFDGNNLLSISSEISKSILSVLKMDALTTIDYFVAGGTKGHFVGGSFSQATGFGSFDGSTVVSTTVEDFDFKNGTHEMENNQIYLYLKGQILKQSSFNGVPPISLIGGRSQNDLRMNGKISELIFIQDVDRSINSAIEADQINYYNIL